MYTFRRGGLSSGAPVTDPESAVPIRGLLAALAAAVLLAVCCAPAQAAPVRFGDLQVSADRIDFGESTGATRQLTLTNVGGSSLEILGVSLFDGDNFSVSGFSGFLNPGQSTVLNVTYSPVSSPATGMWGFRSDTINIRVANEIYSYDTWEIPVTAQTSMPAIRVLSGVPMDFGTLEVGETKTVQFVGTYADMMNPYLHWALEVSPPVFDSPAFSSPDFTSGKRYAVYPMFQSVDGGDSEVFSFTVSFTATVPGAITGAMTLDTNEGVQSVPLKARVIAPSLSAPPVTFTRPGLGDTVTASVSIKNSGEAPARIASTPLAPGASGAGEGDFAVTAMPTQLAPGATGTATFSFTPSARGDRSAVARLLDASGRVLLEIPLTGKATAPVLQSPTSAAFGLVKTGGSTTRTVTVSNTGDAPLIFSDVRTVAPFSVTGDTSPLAAGASRTFVVRFAPTSDGDASGSLVLETDGGNATVALTATASSSLPLETGTPLSTGGARPSDVATGDVNEDGRLDVIVGFAATGAVAFAPGRGDGTFDPLVTIDAADDAGAMGLAVGDVNLDGHLDLVVGGPQRTRVFLGRGDGAFTRSTLALLADEVALGDLDDDGDLDLVSARRSAPRIAVWRGLGDGTFTAAFQPVIPPDAGGRSVFIGDLDRDGDLDIAAGWTASGRDGTKILLNDGKGTLASESASFFTSFYAPLPAGGLALSSFTADARPDLINGAQRRNGRNGVISATGATAGEAVVALDLNGDGRDDLVTASRTEDAVHAALGNGAGGISSTLDVPTGSSGGDQFASLATGDLNGDGRPDVVAAKGGEQVDVLLGGMGPSQAGTGKALISEARFGGDGYVQVRNRSRSDSLRLDDWELRFPGGQRLRFPAGTRVQPGGTALATTPLSGTTTPFSLAPVARGVVGVPGAATGVALTDPSGNVIDVVGLTTAPTAYREGAGLAPTTFRGQGAYVRRTVAGALVDTGANAGDFIAVDSDAQPGDAATLGAPRPDRYDAPTDRSDILQSSLFDPTKPSSAAPNREKLTDDTFIIRRTLTNCSGGLTIGACANADKSQPAVRVTRLRFRVTDLTTVGNSTGAQLAVLPTPSDSVYSFGMKLLAPSAPTGGGINATLTPSIFLGLNPGESVDIEFTLKILRGGAYRFGYATEDDLEPLPAVQAPPAAEAKVPDAEPVPEVVKGSVAPPADPVGSASTTPASAPLVAPKQPTATKARCVTRKQLARLKGKARKRAKLCRPTAAAKAPAKKPASAKR